MKFPRYGCLKCRFHSDSFKETVEHMEREQHFEYNSDGTIRMAYPIFLRYRDKMALAQYGLTDCPNKDCAATIDTAEQSKVEGNHYVCGNCGTVIMKESVQK